MEGLVNFVCIYVLKLQAYSKVKDQFYESLDAVINRDSASEKVYLLDEISARVGPEHKSWPNVLGHHSIGKQNENGQSFLNFPP